jgi:predicted Zn finger-like uncharacterized protein
MSIVTQCPSCGTQFRVTPPQLQAQHGMVRCGRCAQVFDGFKTLATLPDTPAPAAAPALEVERERVPPAAAVEASTPAAAPPPPPALTPAAQTAATAAPIPPAISPDGATPNKKPLGAPSALPPLTESALEVNTRRRRRAGWAVGIAFMLFCLAAQAAYFYRNDIAASLPEARPALNKMCELLHCTVALPQRPRQISIEASDMQALDPANPGLIALTATLRNHATGELGYPALDVVLTDTKEHTVARRIFMPAEYLASGRDPRSGIAPNAEVTIRLELETGDLGAAGFRLDLIAATGR